MAAIDRMEAEARAGLSTTELDRELVEAKNKLRRLESVEYRAQLGMDDKEFEREYAATIAKVEALNRKKAEVRVGVKEIKDANREAATLQKRLEAMEAAQRKVDKAQVEHERRVRQHIKTYQEALDYESKWYEAEQRHYRDRAVMQQRALDMDRRRTDRQQADMRSMAGLHQQALDMDRQRNVELAKQRQHYTHLLAQQQKITFDIGGDNDANALKRDRLSAELELTRHRIVKLGGSYDNLRAHEEDGITRWKRMVKSLGAVRLQMGPISATLRQTAIGFTALGPVIFSVIGQLASLVGVLGTSLYGALAVSTAGIAGFGLSALGAGLLLKPLIGDLMEARSATKEYDEAIKQYGKGSEQAAEAQKKMNQALKGVGPEGRQALKDMSDIGREWTKLTASKARPVFFDALNAGLQAVQRVLPTFGRESVKTFRTLGDESKRWFSMMSSGEAVAGIQTIMSTFRGALPAISGGFRNLFTGISRVGVAASRFLPSLMRGFEQWTQRFTGSGDLNSKIARLVEHMQQLGRFAQSTGSMLSAFFNAGANEGAGLLSTVTSIFDRWTAWMNSAGGQNSLANFFSEANSLGSSFFSTVTSMGVALFELSQALAPLSAGFVSVIRAVSQFASAVLSLAPARGVITALGGALAGAFVVGKIMAAATAIGTLVSALRTLGVAGTITSLASLTNPLMALGALAGAAVAGLSLLSSAGDKSRAAMDALAASMSATKAAMDGLAGNDMAATSAKLAVASAQASVTSATNAYNQAVDKYGANSKEASAADANRQAALQGLSSAQQQAAETAKTVNTEQQKVRQGVRQDIADAQKRKQAAQEILEQANKSDWTNLGMDNFFTRGKRSLTDFLGLTAKQSQAQKDYRRALAQVRQAEEQIVAGRNKLAQSSLNEQRRSKGLAAVANDIGAAWRNVKGSLPKRTISEIIGKADPQQASNVIKLTSSLKDMGKMGQARKILLNTSSIDEAIAKLKRLNAETRRSEKKRVDVDANTDKAKGKIRTLNSGLKGRPAKVNVDADTKRAEADINRVSKKRGKTKVVVTADSSAANAAISRVSNRKIPPKKVRITGDASNAQSAMQRVSSAKIPDKKVKYTADASAAESANRTVQGFRDKTVNVRTAADLSGASAARSALASVNSKTVTITTVHRTVGKARGGPVTMSAASGKGAMSPAELREMRTSISRPADKRFPASDKRNVGTTERANTKQNRPGVYKRPTLLVGEENRTEYVIASNPSYRADNEKYLAAAANEFGFSLVRGAAKGAAPKKNPTNKAVGTGTNKYIASLQNRYDFYRGEISRLTGLSSQRRSDQDLDIRAGKQTGYKYGPLLDPLNEAQTVYSKLEAHIGKMLRAEQKSVGRSRRIDRKNTPKKLQKDKKAVNAAKKALKSFRKKYPKNNKGIRKREKALADAQKQYDTNKRDDKEARANVVSRQGNIAQLWRELNQTVPGEKADLAATIRELQYMKDGLITEDSSGGSSTPMGVQMGQYDAARYAMFKDFGSNISPLSGAAAGGGNPFIPGGGAGAPSGNMPTGPSFYRASAPGGSSPASGSAPATGGGGTTVTQNITISEPPPDPHSFSQQLGWEAGLVG